ncbi:MAG: DUF4878 domain-containing protein [Dehalococcoidales bacterium]|nr:MAG: DUF4878 domain-containing protein [Dehalococcoidales bacterium]
MLKKCLLIGMVAILLVSIGALTSCKGYPATPEDVVKEVYRCLSEGDYDGCKRLFSKDTYFPTESEFREILEDESNLLSNYDYFEVGSVDIEGDEAIVRGTIHYGGLTQPDTTVLIKEDGRWKIYD